MKRMLTGLEFCQEAERNKINQRKLAAESGVAESVISVWKKGGGSLTTPNYNKLVDAYNRLVDKKLKEEV